jgi:hypothetical protein
MPGGGWANESQTAELTSSDGAADDYFGFSVGVSTGGATVGVGAFNATVPPTTGNIGQGAAYVFVMPGTGWVNATQSAKLTASDGATGDNLGTSVGVSNDSSTIAAGAPDAMIGANTNQGAAYIFVLPGGGWAGGLNETAKLSNTVTGATGDYLGTSVGVSANGGTVVAGAYGRNSGTGAVDVFVMPGTGWATTTTFSDELAASKVFNANDFGFSVGVTGDGNGVAGGVPGLNSQGTGAVSVNLATSTTTFTGAPATEPYQAVFVVPAATTNSTATPVYTSSGSCTNSGTTYTMTSGSGTCEEIVTVPSTAAFATTTIVQKTKASKIAPTVTFTGAPATEAYQGTFTVSSSTNSSSSPVYTASGSCSNVGTLYTMTKGSGTCTSKVSWVTDTNYLKADLTQATTGTPIGQTISFTTSAPPTAQYQSTFPVAAESTSGLKVKLSVSSGSVCRLGVQTETSGITSATVTMTGGTGTCYIDANQAGNSNYTAATQQFTWAAALKIGQTITITTPAPSSASNGSTFSVGADASSGLKVALSVNAGSTSVCELGTQTETGGITSATVTMTSGVGTCTIDANEGGNSNYTAATQQQTSAAAN